jgi:hypothetical protein
MAILRATTRLVTQAAFLLDPLRGDPRFEKFVESLAPKDTKQ